MANNIIQIGTALKWRGVYDSAKKYYKDNVITCFGCVFRCSVTATQGNSPVVLDEQGHIEYANQDQWDVLIDFKTHYNHSIDMMKWTGDENIFDSDGNINMNYLPEPVRIATEAEMEEKLAREKENPGSEFAPGRLYYVPEEQ